MTLPVTRVTVHPDGAIVVREGRLAPVDGLLAVRALPLLLDPSSVRVTVRGAPIGEVRVEVDVLGEDRGPAPPAHEAWLDAEEEVAALWTALEAARDERRALERLAPAWDGDPERPVPDPGRMLAWAAADDALAEAAAVLDDRIRDLARRHAERAEALEILRRRLEDESSEGWWRRWLPTRRALVRVDAAGEVEVEVSYRVPGATWTPSYVLDADAPLRAGRFAMRALVVQASGEDWRGVRLSLSTAPSERAVDVPELAALRLGARQPAAPTGWRELPADLEALFPDDLERLVPRAAPAALPEGRAPDREEEVEDLAADVLGDDEWAPEEEPVAARAAAMPVPARKAATRSLAAFGKMTESFRSAAPPPPAAPAGAVATREAARPPEPEGLDVAADLLDYGRLRMAGWDAPPGVRGHLRPIGDDHLLAEAGLPDVARAQLARRVEALREEARAATRRPLPPHHVVPGPIGGSDLRIDAAGAVDVPSDGRFHSVAVAAWPATLEVAYRAVPRHDPRAFRRVTATLAHTGPLVGGPVDVYVDGRLELTTPWAGAPGRGRLLLGLGAEDRLKLARNVRYREEAAGVFGGSRRLFTSVEVQVASSLGRPVQVEILERIPVPLDPKEATVELTEASPVARPYEGEPDGPILKGGRLQVLEVPPGGEGRATLTWAVTLGAKDEITGGDRRG